MLDSHVLGFSDFDRDGRLDAALALECTGFGLASCCAGRSSHLIFIAPVAIEKGSLRLIGSTPVTGGSGRGIIDAEVKGQRIVTHEREIYPEDSTEAELGYPPDAELTDVYDLRDGDWVVTSQTWRRS